ncbi:7 transmembrane receptor [Ancylostoma duodenale]|uniref:7 transmembrane receptor n=1 Tax=Ancylostoma duodenale TaxID=51022 RepID=A0A0C2CKJ5_9BILA|nr:7 transmembrane receptor [Ancylostoma duodenale]
MNLAMADLITLCVGLPFELIMNWSQYPWPFPDVFCNLKALIAETTNYASIMTILLFSIERYIAVCHPFVFVKLKSLRQNVNKVLCLAWIISAISASPFGFYHRADYILKDWPGTENNVPVFSSKMCMVAVLFDRSSLPMYKVIFHLSALLFFAIPLSIIFVLHILIALHNSGIAFSHKILSGFLFYLAPIVNPILYNVVSSRFRKATKDLLLSVFCPARLPQDSVMLRRSSVKYVM